MATVIEEDALIVENKVLGPKLHIMVLEAPSISAKVAPGQFVHAKLPGMEAHILRRPFSVYAASSARNTIEILYQVVGSGSAHMTTLKAGETINLMGPIGSSWSPPQNTKRALLVAGGVGAAPLFMLAEVLAAGGAMVDVVLGAQTKTALVCHSRYEDLLTNRVISGSSLRCATDDGSFGHAGFCTELVENALAENSYDYAAVCGPEPMMKIVSSRLIEASVPCEISLEKRMACGIGACLSCVVETTDGMKRACVDGPVFDARKVVF